MSVVELRDERIRPGLRGVDGDMHVVLAMPVPPLLLRHGQGNLYRLQQRDNAHPRALQRRAHQRAERR